MNDIRRVLSYNDVTLCPRNSNLRHLSEADIVFGYKDFADFSAVPLINAPMDKVCSPALLNLLSQKFTLPTTIHRFFKTPQEQIEFYSKCDQVNPKACFLSVGNIDKWQCWIDCLLKYWRANGGNSFSFLVDMANGDTQTCVDTVAYIRKATEGMANIMAGNVATRSGYCRLEDAGANFIRVGIGGGSICTTRINTGFGIPTLTSVLDCAKVKTNSYLIADGGVESPGDVCKAMAAGADMVMAGKMFAGTDLSAGEKFDKKGKLTTDMKKAKYVAYRGMASAAATEALGSKKSGISVEGVSGFVPYIGTTEDVVTGVLGNLQSSVGYYGGCKNWIQFKKRIKLCELTPQGWAESGTRVLNSIG